MGKELFRKIELFLFDMDGLLFDTESIYINYGKQIEYKYGKDKLSKLQNKVTSTNASMLYGRKGEAYFNNNYLYSGSDDGSYGIKVERIWFGIDTRWRC